jgi:ABC-2 type transport system permease protein
MTGAFLYLTACSTKNRVLHRLRRLREPRYLIGAIVGALYLYFFIGRRRNSRSIPSIGQQSASQSASQFFQTVSGPLQFIGSVLLFGTAVVAWFLPGMGRPLEFSRSEVQYLFAAPVTRRQLVHYKLLRSQLNVLFGAVVTTLLMRPPSATRGWTMVAGIWLLLIVVRLHLMGVALSRNSVAKYGTSGLARQWLPLAVVLGAVGVLAASVVMDWPTMRGLADGEAVFEQLRRLWTTGAAGVVLWPFRILVRLPMASSAAEFLSVLPYAVLLLALNYIWVIRADAAFEEASANDAEKRAATRRTPVPVVRGRDGGPFELGPVGPAETAILWKNIILVGRYLSLKTVLRLLPLLVLVLVLGQGGYGIASFVGTASLVCAAFAVLLGPQMFRNDLRQDLGNLAMLKTWPVRGATLIRGEVLAPTLISTALAWLFIFVAAAMAPAWSMRPRPEVDLISNRVSYALAAAVLAPGLILSQTVTQNALAVMFPAWVSTSASRARGIEAMGQRLLMLAGIFLTLVVSVLPGALAGGIVFLAARWMLDLTLVVIPAVVAALVVVGECWVATELLGRVMDRTDISAVDATE